MDSLETNKAVASVLVAGITFFLCGTLGDLLVRPHRPAKPAIEIPALKEAASSQPQQPAEVPIAVDLAKADLAKGEGYAHSVCAACHTFNQGEKAGVGPNLYGVVGAPHGHMQGYDYSEALKSKQGPWTYDELNEWLTKPSAYAKGTKMTFAGIPDEQLRADVIDFLHTLSPNPEPLPKPEAPPAAGAPAQTPAAAPPAAASQGQAPAPGK